jgi:hypothetical protein
MSNRRRALPTGKGGACCAGTASESERRRAYPSTMLPKTIVSTLHTAYAREVHARRPVFDGPHPALPL